MVFRLPSFLSRSSREVSYIFYSHLAVVEFVFQPLMILIGFMFTSSVGINLVKYDVDSTEE